MRYRRTWILVVAALCLASFSWLQAQAPASQSSEPNLTEEQMKEFLLRARVIASRRSGIGITGSWRLTLTDGTLTHDASFQPVNERKGSQQLANGRTELNFVDSYHYNIAAYELAKLLGMNSVIPVYVEREWNRQTGSLSWWLAVMMDEGTRLQRKIAPPNPDAWNKQMYNLRVFGQLVADSDPNVGQFLITGDWKIWRNDFSRAFRLSRDLQSTRELPMCGRELLAKLKTLNRDEVLAKTRPHLTNGEITSMMARRDKLVAHFDQLVAQQGETGVLF